jgi:tRNA(adenine34) deaminase
MAISQLLKMETRLTDQYEVFMKSALQLARAAGQAGEVPIGALVVLDDKIIAKAANEREASGISTHHAEILAIERACAILGRWRLNDCDLYVTLEPCFMCAGAIVLTRFRKVIFGATDPKAGAVGSLYDVLGDTRLNHRPEVLQGVLQEECGQLLSDFFRARRKANSSAT